MRYSSTIQYEGKRVTVNVTTPKLSGNFELPQFLKEARLWRGHTIQQAHMLTDFPTAQCQDFEDGKQRISKQYLELFTYRYNLPRKIKHLGYEPKEEVRSFLTSRLREIRLNHDSTQAMTACDLGMSRGTYAGYENGTSEPDIQTLINIANYYNVSLDYLTGRYEQAQHQEWKKYSGVSGYAQDEIE